MTFSRRSKLFEKRLLASTRPKTLIEIMFSSFRLARVVLGVTGACVMAGAVAGVLCAAALLLIIGDLRSTILDPGVYVVAGMVGGVCGLILGPAAAFGFLRRVPLGRLFAETAIGAALGGLAGFMLSGPLDVDPALALVAAACGFAVAVTHLSWRHRENAHRAVETSASPSGS